MGGEMSTADSVPARESGQEEGFLLDSTLELVPSTSSAERHFALLSQAGALLLLRRDPEGVVQEIAEQVVFVLDCDVFLNYVIDDASGRLRLNACEGVDVDRMLEVAWLDKGEAVCGCVAVEGVPMVAEDVQASSDARAAFVRSLGIQAYACHPLRVDGTTMGTLSFGTKRRPHFQPEELALMRAVADLVSVAIERARFEQELERSRFALEESERRAQDLIRYAPTGIYEIDFRPPRFLSVNDAMCALSGYSHEELMTMSPFELLDPVSQELFRERVQQVIRGGTPSDEVEFRVRRKDGTEIFVVLKDRFVYDSVGNVTGAFVIGHDVTERRHADEERTRLLLAEKQRRKRIESLHQVLEVAVSSLSVQGAASGILSYLVEHHGFDLAAVWLERGGLLDLVASNNYPDSFVRRYSPTAVAGPLDISAVYRSGEPIRVEEIGNANPQVRRAYKQLALGIGAYVVVPIRSRGRNIGVLHFAWHHPHQMSDEDVAYYQSLGAEIGVVLENARLYECEHGIAETLQETLIVMPSHVPGIEFSRSYETATLEAGRVGGDFVDVFEAQPNIVGLSLGDVSGKGIDAAVTTSLIRNTLRVHALDGLPAADVVHKANTVMRRFIEVDSFVTLWFGLLDTRTGELRYVCAGHPPALVVSPGGAIRELRWQDPFLGAFRAATFTEFECVLHRGERLVLYSDGIIEARAPSGEFLGEEGLHDLVRRFAKQPTSAASRLIMDEVIAFSEGVLRDDAALLVIAPQNLWTRRRKDA